MSATGGAADARESMDRMYRLQRHFYDLTRKYYLFGRDGLIERLGAGPGETVLEVGCGTARNLVKMARRYPDARFYGLDASDEMLKTAAAAVARAGLSGRLPLAQAYAQTFTPATFGLDAPFDRIVFSYTLSIIPGPVEALDNALAQLKPGGTLHVVDFGDAAGLPGWFRGLLAWWLEKFHVAHRPEVGAWFAGRAADGSGRLESRAIGGRYAEFFTLTKA
ncbi:O-methyltransferase [Thalassobaculum fulvum]|uniref:O-methyltransferase n=1 Tax=Thalassobaculum fulvum TaxID=1633335 RepID=A0A919CRQ1_9PROT|nr:methyltransferase domain-containing protein [Thalassobaculum fulvum]GHD59225.1 O-methyltransferase [Thalassobaculum fulvum]